ncbi:MAG: phosphoribosylglycinamide formyltransferase [Deltaproteobacteria bacterium]|nr:phosphoribosylglycinamide formyltransferase [Sandaracinaceae bacterium]MCX7808012.1 phosphoribosylglycinamide formyltransferase [Deltaproteobacteria bacterium]MDW8246870.1 phosphoribosylglycinamide formyltransferase [Sandaracinaceae bacterium]
MALRVVLLASGRGSNLVALAEAISKGQCDAEIIGVISDRHDAPALGEARRRGFATAVVPLSSFSTREEWDDFLTGAVERMKPELVVLAGFMRIVGPRFIAAFSPRIINIHPSLLPAFPGRHAVRDALAKGVRLSGCTVHIVDEGVDSGPIIAQAAVPVFPNDDENSLHARIQKVEHRLLPQVVNAIAQKVLELKPEGANWMVNAFWRDGVLASPSCLELSEESGK